MTEPVTGISLFIGISIVTAFVTHSLIRSYLLATLTAAVLSTTIFQLAVYFHLGHLDPFFTIALSAGALLAGAIAAIIGIPFVRRRKTKE